MKRSIIIIFIALLSISFNSIAQEQHPIDKWLDTYMSVEQNQSTIAMIDGYKQAQDKWDKELNKVYNSLMKKLDATAKEALKKSQKSWLKFRDDEFSFISNTYSKMDGTVWPLNAAANSMLIIKNRALELKAYLENLSMGDE